MGRMKKRRISAPRVERRLGGLDRSWFRGLSFPRQRRVLMRVATELAMDEPTTSLQSFSMTANGLNAPFFALGNGTQPVGYTAWNTFYQQYRVLGSKCKVWLFNTNTAGDTNDFSVERLLSGLVCTDNSSFTGTPVMNAVATGLVKWKEWIPICPYTGGSGVNLQAKPIFFKRKPDLVAYYSGKKYWNVKDIRDDVAQVADWGANPSSVADFRYLWGSVSGDGTAIGHVIRVEIDYIVDLMEPKNIFQTSAT